MKKLYWVAGAALVAMIGGHASAARAADMKRPSYCKVLGTAKPTSDSDIRFEVVIPEGSAWNGRYLQVGNGGFAGKIPEGSLFMGPAAGYAVAGTDDGHVA